MDGDEHMNEVPSENMENDSLDKDRELEDDEDLKLSVVTEEVAVNGCVSLEDASPNTNIDIIEGRSISGVKRARMTVDEQQPSVHFTYNSLTRASRQKLRNFYSNGLNGMLNMFRHPMMITKCWNLVRRHFFLLYMLDLKRHLLCHSGWRTKQEMIRTKISFL